MCWGVLRHCPISGKFQIKMTLLFFHLRISQKLWKCFPLVQVHIWKPFIVLRLMLKQFSENLQKAPPSICLVWSWVTSEAAWEHGAALPVAPDPLHPASLTPKQVRSKYFFYYFSWIWLKNKSTIFFKDLGVPWDLVTVIASFPSEKEGYTFINLSIVTITYYVRWF